ncbi:hypothetical protein KC340_g10087 [Hortaea werneckii]|nr:hypothetical protein KC342_g12796 [Hortaea werneckii]KAI7093291.1 hypothetical protein KC339_g12119 [Hortaea werneckii]KAI7311726.1 hypothetical protein KC340_g10087 [Hortaea werneckii]KAI7386691.1 hypothetical protein KC328_g9777 [Hortaea werneckii]
MNPGSGGFHEPNEYQQYQLPYAAQQQILPPAAGFQQPFNTQFGVAPSGFGTASGMGAGTIPVPPVDSASPGTPFQSFGNERTSGRAPSVFESERLPNSRNERGRDRTTKPVSQPSNMDEGAAGPSTNPPKRSMSNTPQQSAQINDQPDEQFAYGARLLEQFGWSRGLPLGRSMQGLSTALHTPEQRNYRHGLGFCGNWDALNTPLTEEELKFERNRPMIFCPSDELRQNNAEIAYAIYVAISQSKSKSVHLRIRGLPKDATGFELYDAESLISANIRLLARATAIAERTRPGSTTSKQFRFTTDRTNNVELDTPELWADALKEASYSAAQELEAQLAVEEGVDPHGLAWSWDESDNQSNTEPGEADLSAQLLEEELAWFREDHV